jgi:hypothetical protein
VTTVVDLSQIVLTPSDEHHTTPPLHKDLTGFWVDFLSYHDIFLLELAHFYEFAIYE